MLVTMGGVAPTPPSFHQKIRRAAQKSSQGPGKGLIFCSLGLMVILQKFIVIRIEIPRRGSLFNSMILFIGTILCQRFSQAGES